MYRSILQARFLGTVLTSLLLFACHAPPEPDDALAALRVRLNVSGTSIAGLVVEVTASDIPEPLLFNITVQNNIGEGTIQVPVGAERRFVVRGFDSDGRETHRGESTADVDQGTNPPLEIVLLPLHGDVPIVVTVADLIVVVEPIAAQLGVGATIQLEGRVVDGDGNEISRDVHWGSSNPVIARVDQDGVVTGLQVGEVEIVASFGHARGSATISVIVLGFNGILLDRDGTPVPNQIIRLLGAIDFATTTDTDGFFSLVVPPETYSLNVRRGMGSPGSADIPSGFDLFGPSIAVAGNQRQDLTLETVSLTVTVRDPAGNVVPNASVSVPNFSTSFEIFPGGTTGGGVGGSAITNAMGVAAITLFPAADISLTATPPMGSPFAPTSVSGISLLDDVSLTVTLTGPVDFSGVLRDRDGIPVANQIIRLLGSTDFTTTTAGDGSFSLAASPGTYSLNVRRGMDAPGMAIIPSGFDLFGPSIDLTANRVQDLTLQNVALDVTVVDPMGSPVPDVSVSIPNFSTSFELFPGGTTSGGVGGGGTTNAAGTARVILFPSANITVNAIPPSGSPFAPGTVTGVSVLADASVTVTLPSPVTFSGVLRDRDGTPVPNQTIRLTGATGGSATTAADGSFAVAVAPAMYTLNVRRAGTGGSASIPSGFDLFGPSIGLMGNVSQDLTLLNVFLDVTVLDPMGVPVPNAFVSVPNYSTSFDLFMGGQTSGGVGGNAVADGSGVARVILFPASSITVNVSPPMGSALLPATVSNVSVLMDGAMTVTLQSP